MTQTILSQLRGNGVSQKLCDEYELFMEELVTKLFMCAEEKTQIHVRVSRHLGTVSARITCTGKPVLLESESYSDYSGMILSEYSEHIKQSYSLGVNEITFSTASSSTRIFRFNILSFLLALGVGLILKLACPAEVSVWANENLISPVTNLFIKALQTVAGPVAFFSLAYFMLVIRRTFDRRDKLRFLALGYLGTGIISTLIGILCYGLFKPLLTTFDFSQYAIAQNNFMGSTLKDFLQQLTGSNLLEPFMISNPIPMLINALLLGFAAGCLFGKSGQTVNRVLGALNDLFSRMLNLIYQAIPFFLFVAVLNTVLSLGFEALWFLGLQLLSLLAAVALLLLFYALQLMSVKVNPLRFISEYKELLLENLKIASNIDAFPYNKRMLARKTKLSRPYLDRGLRLGILLNMDGNCLYITVLILQTIAAVGLHPGLETYLGIVVILFLFSVGAPNQPGSLLMGFVILMSYVGISPEFIGFVLILEAFTAKYYSFLNALGDIVTLCAVDAAQRNKN